MDQRAIRTCFYSLLFAFAVGCQPNDEVSESPSPRKDERNTENLTETNGRTPGSNDSVSTKEPSVMTQPIHEAGSSNSTKQDGDVIDLSLYAKYLKDYLRDSIARFAAEHPDVEVSCIAFYFTTYGSSVYLNYETPSHSAAWVEKYQGNDDFKYYVGEDRAGFFNKEPNSFEYGQHDEFAFKALPNFYEVKWPVKFRTLDGKVKEVDSYDQSVGQVLLESFEPALKSFDQFDGLKRSDVFRMGIYVHNTTCEAFWIHKSE